MKAFYLFVLESGNESRDHFGFCVLSIKKGAIDFRTESRGPFVIFEGHMLFNQNISRLGKHIFKPSVQNVIWERKVSAKERHAHTQVQILYQEQLIELRVASGDQVTGVTGREANERSTM